MPILLQLPACVKKYVRGDKVIFINPDVPAWVVTNNNGAVILSLCNGSHSIDEIVNHFSDLYGSQIAEKVRRFVQYTISTRIFDVPSESEIPIVKSFGKINLVQFSISPVCNLNCRYCYATDRTENGQKRMTVEDYKRVVDDILTISEDAKFTLTGGEPLTNKDCFAIAKYIKSKNCFVDLLTNGTLITANNVLLIKECFDKITISMDGSTSDKHDFFRGKGAYEKSSNAVDLLEQYEVDYELSMTVNKVNIDDVEAMANKYGNRLRYAPLFPAGNANKSDVDLSISGKEYYDALNSASNVNPLSFCESALENSKHCRACKCAVGNQELSVSATGDVYPCQLLHYPEFLIGNIHDTPISELWKTSPIVERFSRLTVDNIEGCKDCSFKYICGGACRARAYHECGKVDVSGKFCEYEREAYLQGIIDYYGTNLLDDGIS